MTVQAPSAVLMIRPTWFAPNPQTAADNAYQGDAPALAVAADAYDEVSRAAKVLQGAGVTVHLFDDDDDGRPDSVFPNNWISTHHGGRIALYPMYAPNRRTERRGDIVELLKARYRVQEVIDYSGLEYDGLFLEGTGAMVLDHEARLAYTARSRRADPLVLERFCTAFGYEPVVFAAVNATGVAVYHTNVLMCVGSSFALIASTMILDPGRRAEVLERLSTRGRRAVIELTEDQINSFAGNAIELQSDDGNLLLAISARALGSLRADQREIIERTHRMLPLDVPTIELGGGSVRCMLAGIHLEARQSTPPNETVA